MTETLQDREARLRDACRRHGQEHVFAFWPRLDLLRRQALLNDLERVRFAELPAILPIVRAQSHADASSRVEPAPFVPRPRDGRRHPLAQRGEALLAASSVAAFTVAGGQGTRLGFDGPKGALPISPVRNKPLFRLFAEQLIATDRRCGGRTPWYIMTSEVNDAATREFFGQHDHFGLPANRVIFFQQGSMPAFSPDGLILLDQPHRLAFAPDGHGGALLAMATTGVLSDMAARGVEHISYFQVDNPLVRCLDPFFLGLHEQHGSEMSSKMVKKVSDTEKVGVFAICDGVMRVLEYSDLPPELAAARNPDGARRFDAGSIAIHVLARGFVERLTADRARFALPWHRAVKKVPHVDLRTGECVEPATANAVKLEAFVFDALPLACNPVVLETDRAEEFSPVKNPMGVDSIATARGDLSNRAARWLESAGVAVQRKPDGSYDGVFEISPLRALEAEDLKSHPPLPREASGTCSIEECAV